MYGQLVLHIAQSVIDALDVVSLVDTAETLLQLVNLVSLMLELLLGLCSHIFKLRSRLSSAVPGVYLLIGNCRAS